MPIGDNIKRIRQLQNVSVADLARKTGIKEESIYAWQRNEYNPSEDNLQKVAKVLGVTVKEFYSDENPTPVQETGNNKEMDKDKVYRDLVEANTEYRLIPKIILDDYRIVPRSELDEKAAMWRETLAGYKETLAAKNDAIAQLEKEIAFLRSTGQTHAPPEVAAVKAQNAK